MPRAADKNREYKYNLLNYKVYDHFNGKEIIDYGEINAVYNIDYYRKLYIDLVPLIQDYKEYTIDEALDLQDNLLPSEKELMDAIIQYLLEENDINDDDIKIVFEDGYDSIEDVMHKLEEQQVEYDGEF